MDLAFITDKYTDLIGDKIMDGSKEIIGTCHSLRLCWGGLMYRLWFQPVAEPIA